MNTTFFGRFRLIAGLLFLYLHPVGATVFCVTDSSALQTALTTAATNAQDDEVRIVQGTYVGNFVYTSTQSNALSVLGGYLAGCISRTLDPTNTILDGNLKNTVFAISTAATAANHIVEGITMRNGRRNGNGAGLYTVTGGDLKLYSNIIDGNSVVGFWDKGGGAFINARHVNISYNLVENNICPDNNGGGFLVEGETIEIRFNTIKNNVGGSFYGGGFYSSGPSWIENNIIEANNISFGFGGGAYIMGAVKFSNNVVRGNIAGQGAGGVSISGENSDFSNNIIAKNSANHELGLQPHGGASLSGRNISVINNTVYGNLGSGGAGLYIEGYGDLSVYNNIIWDNTGDAENGLYVRTDINGDFILDLKSIAIKNNNLVLDSDLPIFLDGSNYINVDPYFFNAQNNDFRLYTYSSMINAGSLFAPGILDVDISGGPRVIGQSIDIGAYEGGVPPDDGSFFDIKPNSWAAGYINAIRDASITGGCGNGNYCPQGLVTREQMAAFLVRAAEGEPAANYCGGSSSFSDVSPSAWSCPHIKRMGELNITGGCGGGNYCPQGLVTREQMAVFIVRALEGNPAANYCNGVAPFNDVSAASWSCGHIKRLVELGVTQGCGNGNYCPGNEVTREQMAAFIARAFLSMD
ncbi:MAG: S-layer homology domain-containing protein [Chromatiaceae bacterium]|nr:S-layer homology domain-containing protein [Chromatiaceae bacterium]